MGRSLSDAELRTMVADVDVDGSGEIDFDEFLIIMARDKKNSDPVDEAMKVAYPTTRTVTRLASTAMRYVDDRIADPMQICRYSKCLTKMVPGRLMRKSCMRPSSRWATI